MTDFTTISDAAKKLGVEAHVLRFWETQFPDVKPVKRRGGRRFYGAADFAILERIKTLLYVEGYTIKGAKAALAKKVETPPPPPPPPVIEPPKTLITTQNKRKAERDMKKKKDSKQIDIFEVINPPLDEGQKDKLKRILGELKEVEKLLVAE